MLVHTHPSSVEKGFPWNIFLRFAILLALEAGFIIALKNHLTAETLGIPFGGKLHFGAYPVQFSAILIAGFLLVAWPRLRSAWGRMRIVSYAFGVAAVLCVAVLGMFVTHPPAFAPQWMALGGVEYPIVSALRYSILLLILPASAFLLFPPTFLKSFRRPLVWCFLFLIAYVWLAALRIVFHAELAGVPLRGAAAILSLGAVPVSASVADLSLRYGTFSATIGAECLGLDGVGMYALLCAALWALKPAGSVRDVMLRLLGISLCAMLLYMLNILRIALIMIVGDRFPYKAVSLFHSGIGALFLFIVFLITVRVLWRRTS